MSYPSSQQITEALTKASSLEQERLGGDPYLRLALHKMTHALELMNERLDWIEDNMQQRDTSITLGGEL
jgi:hypothetical protein